MECPWSSCNEEEFADLSLRFHPLGYSEELVGGQTVGFQDAAYWVGNLESTQASEMCSKIDPRFGILLTWIWIYLACTNDLRCSDSNYFRI